MNLSDLQDLYRHMEWADAEVWRAVCATETAASDQKVRELFYHVHLVQHAFLRAWRGEPVAPFPRFEELRAVTGWGREYYPQMSAHFQSLTDESISTTMQLPWAEIVERELGRKPAAISIRETMLQVPLHSQYHRGQINARLRNVGGEPPRVDYIVWMWLERPAPDWNFV
jgi:uncharacterized damage-inducible protein DinB